MRFLSAWQVPGLSVLNPYHDKLERSSLGSAFWNVHCPPAVVLLRSRVPWNFGGHTDRQTDRQTDKHTDRQTDRQTDTQTDRQTDRHTDTRTDRHTDRQADRQTDRQTDRDTETQTHTHTHTRAYIRLLRGHVKMGYRRLEFLLSGQPGSCGDRVGRMTGASMFESIKHFALQDSADRGLPAKVCILETSLEASCASTRLNTKALSSFLGEQPSRI